MWYNTFAWWYVIAGLVILASGISDVDNLSIHLNLVNRVMTRDTDCFNSLKNVDWFMALSQKSVMLRKVNCQLFVENIDFF